MLIVKVGGGQGVDLDAVCADVAQLVRQGEKLVLIHGGSDLTNQLATQLGHPPRFITSPSGFSSRHSDRRTMQIFMMAYCGQINKEIVVRLQKQGVNAVGLSGLDGGLWQGPRKKAIRAERNGRTFIIRDSYTGKVERVNIDLLRLLLDGNCLPVVTPPALSDEGEAINVDGDRAAAATAVALGADKLIILSNVPGVLTAFPDEASLLPAVEFDEIEDVMARYCKGRMRIKLLGAQEALLGGVREVVIGDSRLPQPIIQARAGVGTVIGRRSIRIVSEVVDDPQRE